MHFTAGEVLWLQGEARFQTHSFRDAEQWPKNAKKRKKYQKCANIYKFCLGMTRVPLTFLPPPPPPPPRSKRGRINLGVCWHQCWYQCWYHGQHHCLIHCWYHCWFSTEITTNITTNTTGDYHCSQMICGRWNAAVWLPVHVLRKSGGCMTGLSVG